MGSYMIFRSSLDGKIMLKSYETFGCHKSGVSGQADGSTSLQEFICLFNASITIYV